MGMIAFRDGGIEVDAEIIADGLGIEASAVHARLREGRITTRYERGVGEDAGRHRLTFITEHRRFRVVIDETGKVLQRSTIRYPDQPPPAAARRRG